MTKVYMCTMENEKTEGKLCMNIMQKIWSKTRFYLVKAAGHIPGFFDGDDYYCNLCGKSSRIFLPYGTKSDAAIHMIGSGVRPHCECPRCFSHDRFRWVYEVLLRHTDIASPERTRALRVLHIAAEPGIKEHLCGSRQGSKPLAPVEYLTGDLERIYSDVQVDVTDMHQFPDESFDYFIINHVMEHVPNEKAAMAEIHRVLKKDGVLFISFPMSLTAKTFEDPSITTPAGRREAYGQEDHVRLYGTDRKERLEAFGFEVQPLVAKEQLPESEVRRMALIPEDTIFMCKPV